MSVELDWDENPRFTGYQFLIGVILSVISLLPLIISLTHLYLLLIG